MHHLRSLKQASTQSSNATEMSDIVNWFDGRIEEIVLRQADKAIANTELIPETKKDAANIILNQITALESSLENIKGYKDTHPSAGQLGEQFTEDQLQAIRKLIRDIKKKKVALFSLLEV